MVTGTKLIDVTILDGTASWAPGFVVKLVAGLTAKNIERLTQEVVARRPAP